MITGVDAGAVDAGAVAAEGCADACMTLNGVRATACSGATDEVADASWKNHH